MLSSSRVRFGLLGELSGLLGALESLAELTWRSCSELVCLLGCASDLVRTEVRVLLLIPSPSEGGIVFAAPCLAPLVGGGG